MPDPNATTTISHDEGYWVGMAFDENGMCTNPGTFISYEGLRQKSRDERMERIEQKLDLILARLEAITNAR